MPVREVRKGGEEGGGRGVGGGKEGMRGEREWVVSATGEAKHKKGRRTRQQLKCAKRFGLDPRPQSISRGKTKWQNNMGCRQA